MRRKTIDRSPWNIPRALLGLILTLIGAAGLVSLQVIVSATGTHFARLQLALGLAGAPLLSALAQILILWGAWLIWSARPRRR